MEKEATFPKKWECARKQEWEKRRCQCIGVDVAVAMVESSGDDEKKAVMAKDGGIGDGKWQGQMAARASNGEGA